MTAAFIFVASILVYLLLLMAFLLKNYPLAMLLGIGIFVVGIYVAIYNIEGINNLLVQAFGVISIMLGLYVFIESSKQEIEELM